MGGEEHGYFTSANLAAADRAYPLSTLHVLSRLTSSSFREELPQPGLPYRIGFSGRWKMLFLMRQASGGGDDPPLRDSPSRRCRAGKWVIKTRQFFAERVFRSPNVLSQLRLERFSAKSKLARIELIDDFVNLDDRAMQASGKVFQAELQHPQERGDAEVNDVNDVERKNARGKRKQRVSPCDSCRRKSYTSGF